MFSLFLRSNSNGSILKFPLRISIITLYITGESYSNKS